MTIAPPTHPSPPPAATAPAGRSASRAMAGLIAFDADRPAGPPWLRPRMRRRQIDRQWLMVAIAMLASGLVFFGWRSSLQVGVTAGVTLLSYFLTGRLIRILLGRAPVDPPLYALASGILLGVCLPVTEAWTIATFPGLALGLVLHFVGRVHRVRLHPIVVTLLLTWVLPSILLSVDRGGFRRQPAAATMPAPRYQNIFPRLATFGVFQAESGAVLRPQRIVVGDVADVPQERATQPWFETPQDSPHDATLRYNPMALLLHEKGRAMRSHNLLANMIISGELPPLQELLIGSVPGLVGATSVGLLIVLGLYLMSRGLSWWPMVLAAVIGAWVMLLLLPVPSPHHPYAVMAYRLMHLRSPLAVTYGVYMMLASPLALSALILAPSTAPTSQWGRLVYGLILGAGLMAGLWFVGLPEAGFLGLAVASLLSRPLDRLQGHGLGSV